MSVDNDCSTYGGWRSFGDYPFGTSLFERMAPFIVGRRLVSRDRVETILRYTENRTVLDLGAVDHCASRIHHRRSWLHGRILEVAEKTVGLDSNADAVRALRCQGYQLVLGDVTDPTLDLDEQFEVIVAGELIEHLDDFRGFFRFCKRHLASHGVLIVTTPCPFYLLRQYHHQFRGIVFANADHTCWISSQNMLELAHRNGLTLEKVYYYVPQFRGNVKLNIYRTLVDCLLKLDKLSEWITASYIFVLRAR